MDKFLIYCMDKNFMSIQHIENFSIFYVEKIPYIQHMEKLSICGMDKLSVYVIYTKICHVIRNMFIMNIYI